MKPLEKKVEMLEFHLELMLPMMDSNSNPLHLFIIKNKLTREEVRLLLSHCEHIELKYKVQKQEGLLYFKPLLDEFREKIPFDFNVQEAVDALLATGHCTDLMREFKKILTDEEQKNTISRR